jgi:hypothetical protein
MSKNQQAEKRASHLLAQLNALCVKLKELKEEIALLRDDFKNLKGQEKIAGCKTWKEFCQRRLHRTDRAVRKLLGAEKSSALEPAATALKPERTIQAVDADSLRAATMRTLAYFKPMASEPTRLRKELTDWFRSVASELGLSLVLEAHYFTDKSSINPRLTSHEVTQ